MHQRYSHPFLRFAALSLLLLVPSSGQAAVTVYTNLASFQAASGATLLVDFESRNGVQSNPFTDNTLTFSTTNQLYVISPSNPGTTSPPPTSKMLSASGAEDFTIDMPAASATGFVLLNNAFGPHTVTLTHSDNSTTIYHPTQAHNTIGFVGFVLTVGTPAIVKMRWQSVNGAVQNTALDDIHWQGVVSPAAPTTWGRMKSLYR